MNYVLTTETTTDLNRAYFQKRNIPYIPYHYNLDGEVLEDDLGETLSYADFYSRLAQGSESTTSQITPQQFIDFFTPILKEGKDIVHVALSSGLSGSFQAGMVASEMLKKEFKDRTIYIIDSLTASSGIGLLADKLADLRDEGKSAEELYQWGMDNRMRIRSYFFSTDLTFFVRGGRLSAASGFIGGLLNICPLMHVDTQGKLAVFQKIRSTKRAIRACVEKVMEEAGEEYSEKIFISHANIPDAANSLKEDLEAKLPNLKEPIAVNYIGTTIGSHTGPGTVAMFFFGDEDRK